jgi:tetratricopeptide (TPR) repeat protein
MPFDNRQAIVPDIPVDYTFADFINGRDPVLEEALRFVNPSVDYESVAETNLEQYTGRYEFSSVQFMDIKQRGSCLKAEFTDFVPGSNFRFSSDLLSIGNNCFKTDIDAVTLKFPEQMNSKPGQPILNWAGVQVKLKRVVFPDTLAFERFSLGEVEAGCNIILDEKTKYLNLYPDLENALNKTGYVHLRKDDISGALNIFGLNVELFPESSNVYDSYGEGLMVSGEIDKAIENYQKSLQLNPENYNARRVIKKLLKIKNRNK